jgi:nucleotide-binding universal stress UspA family protein
MRRDVSSEGVDAIADVRWGDFAEQILLHARHADADLIVLPNRDIGGRAGWLRRSAAERILAAGDTPLLICPAELPAQRSKRILVPLDGSPEAEAALPEAVRFAANTGARIDLLAVIPRLLPTGYGTLPFPIRVPDRTPYLDEVARDLELTEVEGDVHFLEGDPAEGILRFARESGTDLVCMATKRRTGWRRYFAGGVAREVLRRAPCPVFVGKSRPRISP